MEFFDRRQALAAGVVSAGTAAHSLNRDGKNPIQAENQFPGTKDWQLTYTKTDPKDKFRSPIVEGYCSKASVFPGETMQFYVSTREPSDCKILLYRLGYYQGHGGRYMASVGPFSSGPQPVPPVGKERLRECSWKESAKLEIPATWTSGVYLGKIVSSQTRYQSYVIFLVKDRRKADFLFQCSDNTWQAYNQWPDGYSLYTNDRPDKKPLVSGVKVSFDRPYGKYVQIMDNPLSQGSGEFLLWEFPLAFWMEQQGFDATYCSNVDIHTSPENLTRVKAFLSVGHDEYWSLEQFKHVKNAVASGLNAVFLSGNTCCFVTPFSPATGGAANRILTRAGRYGGVRPKEERLMADLHLDGPNESTLIGAQTVSPFNGSGDWIVTKASHWLFEGTGMKNGDRIPGLVGWEFHGEPAAIPGLEIVAEGPTWTASEAPSHYTATIYPGPKGNWVFNASTIFWAQGLSQPPGHMPPISHHGRPHGPDARVQKITANLFQKILKSG
ncbi:MAG: hypothetical protein EXR99_01730 [Gemmataceae bacterium]|nr:hypothetical protein [Gemmataceae bacterium]